MLGFATHSSLMLYKRQIKNCKNKKKYKHELYMYHALAYTR